jgi:hypothetical protein
MRAVGSDAQPWSAARATPPRSCGATLAQVEQSACSFRNRRRPQPPRSGRFGPSAEAPQPGWSCPRACLYKKEGVRHANVPWRREGRGALEDGRTRQFEDSRHEFRAKESSIRVLGPGVIRHSGGSDAAEAQADAAPQRRQQTASTSIRPRPCCTDNIVGNHSGCKLICVFDDSTSLLLGEIATTQRDRYSCVLDRIGDRSPRNPDLDGLDDEPAAHIIMLWLTEDLIRRESRLKRQHLSC